MPKSWKCEVCNEPVSEIGAYAKLALYKYAHLNCYTKHHVTIAFQAGRQALLDEQAKERAEAAERERKEREERAARERAEAERRAEIAERERVNRIQAQRNMPLPARVEPRASAEAPKAEPKTEAERKDRFELLDID